MDIKIEPIQWAHRSLIEERCHQLQIGFSEYLFSSIYLFSYLYHDELVRVGQDFYVTAVSYDKLRYLIPLQIPSEAALPVIEELLLTYSYLYPIPDEWLPLFSPERFAFSWHEAESDYIFTVSKLRDYPGRHLSPKRNLVKQFVESYKTISIPLTTSVRADAARVE